MGLLLDALFPTESTCIYFIGMFIPILHFSRLERWENLLNLERPWETVRNYFFFLSTIITFFCRHKKKVLGSRKFLTSGFWWIYRFWGVLNTIWPFLENVCLSICLSVYMSPKFCRHYNSRTNAQKLVILYVQLHLDII